ncbi:MAG: YbbR-like domain-containing protein [Candidatus Eisenbacteria bacterium]|nr:YbbR-like domain-containing protein [Candidatus Eisenbacteria bacterium]
MSLRDLLTQNRTLKVAAAIAALVLWLLAKGEQTTAREFVVPLVLRGVPEGLTTAARVPESARIVLSGANKELLRLGLWGEPYAVVDLSGADPEVTIRVFLSEADVVLPRDSRVAVTEVRQPRVLDIHLDRVAERRLPVRTVLEGAPARGYYLVGEPLCFPDSVAVIGPARVVAALESAPTEPLDLSGRRERIEATRTVDVSLDANLHAVPREVRVAVDIEGTSTRRLSGVRVRVERETGGASAAVTPANADVDLSGPAHVIDALTTADVAVVVDARGLPRGTHEVVPEVVLPEGALLTSVTPARFTVTLE